MPTASKGTLYEALHAFQADAPDLIKNATNDHFRNSYITLDELVSKVRPALNAAGLVFMQLPSYAKAEGESAMPILVTRLVHAPSGDSVETSMPLLLDKSNPQGQGSAITYARRYSLLSILGLVADVDDDGNAASPQPARKTSGAGSQVASSLDNASLAL